MAIENRACNLSGEPDMGSGPSYFPVPIPVILHNPRNIWVSRRRHTSSEFQHSLFLFSYLVSLDTFFFIPDCVSPDTFQNYIYFSHLIFFPSIIVSLDTFFVYSMSVCTITKNFSYRILAALARHQKALQSDTATVRSPANADVDGGEITLECH
jgi:hypothetical protein